MNAKMTYLFKAVLMVLQITWILSAPMNPFMKQMLQQSPYQMQMVPSQQTLDDQLIALQQLQALRRLGFANPMLGLNMQQPPFILIINPPSLNSETKNTEVNENYSLKHLDGDMETINEDLDSVTIEAKPNKRLVNPPQAILILPNQGRFGIGSIISALPWFPIEVNVPDTISWIYDGISGIISGIGQNLPFRPRPPQNTALNEGNMKFLMDNNLPNMKSGMINPPFMIVPLPGPMLPL